MCHINYGILVWGQQYKALEKLQNKVVRIITCSKYNAHSSPLYRRPQILKIYDVYTLAKLKFYYKHIANQLPSNLQRMSFATLREQHNYNTRGAGNLIMVSVKHAYVKKWLRHDLQITINSIPIIMKDLKIIQSQSSWNVLLFQNVYHQKLCRYMHFKKLLYMSK